MNKKSTISEILFMLILSFICAALLGGTRAAIGERADLSEQTVAAVYDILENSEVSSTCEVGEACEVADAVKYALHVEDRNKDRGTKGDYKRFLEEFNIVQKGRIKYWKNASDTNLIACEATGSGMWDEITLVLVYDLGKKLLLGIRVTEQKETAGIGSRITEEEFYSKFTNVSPDIPIFDAGKEIPAIKVDAITGATISSKSVEKLLDKALRGMP